MLALFARLSPLQWCCGHGATLIGFFQKKKKTKKKDLAVRLGGGICGVVVLSALFIPPTLVGRNGRKVGAFRQRFGGSGMMNLLAFFFSFSSPSPKV